MGRTNLRPGFSFFLMVSVFLLFDKSGMGSLCVVAVLLHELGHIIMLNLLGVRILSVKLCGFGIGIEREEIGSYKMEAAVDIAGPMMNLLLAAGSAAVGMMRFSAVNLALGLFELCPLPTLDGGQAVYCLAASRMSIGRTGRLCAAINKAAFALMVLLSLFLVVKMRNFTLLLLLCALGLQGR